VKYGFCFVGSSHYEKSNKCKADMSESCILIKGNVISSLESTIRECLDEFIIRVCDIWTVARFSCTLHCLR